ncbi:MAG: hypothetical protein O3A78_11580 [Nitrospinae bacterium]|nr:hypothetical protein [Nitrospinota bacterium]MDA1110428.1 hypothetical protein [Nitrospinota bacterium]
MKAPKSSMAKRQTGMLASDSIAQAVGESSSLMEADQEVFDGGQEEPAVQVRADFRATAFWQPNVITNKKGQAKVKVKFPDSLTEWRATARVVAENNRFGIGSGNSRTRKPLTVRLQAPRFFVVGDSLTISAIINNNTDAAMKVSPSITLEGVTLLKGKVESLELPAGGEKRIDWQISVDQPVMAKIQVAAKGSRLSGKVAWDKKSAPRFWGASLTRRETAY